MVKKYVHAALREKNLKTKRHIPREKKSNETCPEFFMCELNLCGQTTPAPAIGNRQSAIGNRQSAIGNRQSAIGNRQSAIDFALKKKSVKSMARTLAQNSAEYNRFFSESVLSNIFGNAMTLADVRV
jgi:hypothetical protein